MSSTWTEPQPFSIGSFYGVALLVVPAEKKTDVRQDMNYITFRQTTLGCPRRQLLLGGNEKLKVPKMFGKFFPQPPKFQMRKIPSKKRKIFSKLKRRGCREGMCLQWSQVLRHEILLVFQCCSVYGVDSLSSLCVVLHQSELLNSTLPRDNSLGRKGKW